MVFSSAIFVFLFLPLVLLCYFLAPKKMKNYCLLFFSLVFYFFGGPKFILVLLSIVLIDYLGAFLIERSTRKKLSLFIIISLNILILCYFKYTGFFITNLNNVFNLSIDIPNIVLPIGISFYTFQALSYVIDVYRKEVKIQRNFFELLLYVSLFPQLVAGPIVRYQTIEKELEKRKTTFDDVVYGIRRFILGLAKKVIIANQMGQLADIVFASNDLTTPVAWLGAFAYMFQIYFDFSAYSDMAIGLGRIFGFKFLENFNFPYISKSITEFWRRWHISLSSWFKDYIYIPLGGNRKGILKQIRNMFIVWILTGFWHGAAWNFILWGLYYFVFLVLEKFVLKKFLDKCPNFINHVYAIIVILFGWVLFRCENLSSCISFIGTMLSFNITDLGLSEALIYLESYCVYFILAIVFSMPTYYKILEKIESIKKTKLKFVMQSLHYFALIVVFVITIMFLAYSSYNPFIYFRF